MEERMLRLGEVVANLLTEPTVAKVIAEATAQARSALAADPRSLGAAQPIPREAFGERLPPELRACRISIMRGGAAYHVERHPGAAQFVYSLENEGTIHVWDEGSWRASALTSAPGAPITSRWHAVPVGRWHQPVPAERDWVVLAIHSVPAEDLVDDFDFPGTPPTE